MTAWWLKMHENEMLLTSNNSMSSIFKRKHITELHYACMISTKNTSKNTNTKDVCSISFKKIHVETLFSGILCYPIVYCWIRRNCSEQHEWLTISVCAASLIARSRGSPILTPPSESASMARKPYAGPLPLSAVTASSWCSGTRSHVPVYDDVYAVYVY